MSVKRVGRLSAAFGLISAGVICIAGAVSPAQAGFSQGTGPCSTGNGNYFGLQANACPFNYILATTSSAASYMPGQTFSFSVVVTNPTGASISVPTDFGWHHILSILDSPTGAPVTRIDVSNGFTPAGFLPLTDYNFFAYGMFRNDVETEQSQKSFTLTVPGHSSVTITETGSSLTCGYFQLDLGGGGETLAGGVLRVLGCGPPGPPGPTPTPTATPTPTPTATATPTPTATPRPTPTPSAPGAPTPTPSPSSGVHGATAPTPGTGSGGGIGFGVGVSLILAGGAMLVYDVTRRRRRQH